MQNEFEIQPVVNRFNFQRSFTFLYNSRIVPQIREAKNFSAIFHLSVRQQKLHFLVLHFNCTNKLNLKMQLKLYGENSIAGFYDNVSRLCTNVLLN